MTTSGKDSKRSTYNSIRCANCVWKRIRQPWRNWSITNNPSSKPRSYGLCGAIFKHCAPNITSENTRMIDDTIAQLFKEYYKVTNKNAQAAATLTLAHVGSSVLYDLFEKEKTVGVSLDLNTNIRAITKDDDCVPRYLEPWEIQTKLWAARNPEQAEQDHRDKLQALANEAWK